MCLSPGTITARDERQRVECVCGTACSVVVPVGREGDVTNLAFSNDVGRGTFRFSQCSGYVLHRSVRDRCGTRLRVELGPNSHCIDDHLVSFPPFT